MMELIRDISSLSWETVSNPLFWKASLVVGAVEVVLFLVLFAGGFLRDLGGK